MSLERDLCVKVEGLFGKMLAQLLLRKTDFTEDVDAEEANREAETMFKVRKVAKWSKFDD